MLFAGPPHRLDMNPTEQRTPHDSARKDRKTGPASLGKIGGSAPGALIVGLLRRAAQGSAPGTQRAVLGVSEYSHGVQLAVQAAH